jgi:hypothetical protein
MKDFRLVALSVNDMWNLWKFCVQFSSVKYRCWANLYPLLQAVHCV